MKQEHELPLKEQSNKLAAGPNSLRLLLVFLCIGTFTVPVYCLQNPILCVPVAIAALSFGILWRHEFRCYPQRTFAEHVIAILRRLAVTAAAICALVSIGFGINFLGTHYAPITVSLGPPQSVALDLGNPEAERKLLTNCICFGLLSLSLNLLARWRRQTEELAELEEFYD